MFGRLGWAAASDYIGRKRTYMLFGLGVPICVLVPTLTATVATSHAVVPLVIFYGGVVTVVSFYGGLFSVLPAYIADIFGPKHVGAIHGRALTAWSGAAIIGPSLMSYLRNESYEKAIKCVARLRGHALVHVDSTVVSRSLGMPRTTGCGSLSCGLVVCVFCAGI